MLSSLNSEKRTQLIESQEIATIGVGEAISGSTDVSLEIKLANASTFGTCWVEFEYDDIY